VSDPTTIVVIDDELGLAEALGAILSDDGYAVGVATNGQLGLRLIEELDPDLVLLDFMMPIMGGPAVLRALEEQGRAKSTPVILMSAATEADVRSVVGNDVFFLREPFDMPLLERAIRTVLARASATSSRHASAAEEKKQGTGRRDRE